MAIKPALYAVVIAAVLCVANGIVRAKFIGDSTSIVNGFYAEQKDSVDLLVVGSSNSFCTIDPVALYGQYGIAAYDFGSSSQPINISLLYIQEAFKRQKPKVVALEANMLIGDSMLRENEAALRWGYTDIPLSLNKLRAIYESTGKPDERFFSYVFPLFRYHNRWKEVSKTDFTYYSADKFNPSKGYLETQSVSEGGAALSEYMSVTQNNGESLISSETYGYLCKIQKLCEKNNASLMLFKSPKQGWYKAYHDAVDECAETLGIRYVDYNELFYNGEIPLDVYSDFRDGDHLNDFGAAKVTAHFGEYVSEAYGLADRRGDEKYSSWERSVEYRLRKGYQPYMDAKSAAECLEMIQNDDRYVIIVTDAGDKKSMVKQWVYEDCRIRLEKQWDEDGVIHLKTDNKKIVLSKLGGIYQILIDGVESYTPGTRWNIVVYDKTTHEISANLCFD